MKSILLSINGFLYKLFFFLRKNKYRKKIKKIISLYDFKGFCLDKQIEKKHIALLSPLMKDINTKWLFFYSAISGKSDYRSIPEDVYYCIIERSLNDYNFSSLAADKNLYDKHYGKENFPKVLLRNIGGSYCDGDYNILTKKEASQLIKNINGEIIIKKSIDSFGGKNISKEKSPNLDRIESAYKKNFLLQEKLSQHESLSKYNPSSINTLRVFTYRSVIDEKIHILPMTLRIGREGGLVDNVSSGGICISINKSNLAKYAYSSSGEKHDKHPDSGIIFEGESIKSIDEIESFCKSIALKIPSHRLLGMDICLQENGDPICVEINCNGLEINFLQTGGESLFGDLTQEVIDYCKVNQEKGFKYLRVN